MEGVRGDLGEGNERHLDCGQHVEVQHIHGERALSSLGPRRAVARRGGGEAEDGERREHDALHGRCSGNLRWTATYLRLTTYD